MLCWSSPVSVPALCRVPPSLPGLLTVALYGTQLYVVLQILKEEKNYAPSRWFRVVAMVNSYQVSIDSACFLLPGMLPVPEGCFWCLGGAIVA